MNYEFKNFISRIGQATGTDLIQTTIHFLRNCKATSAKVEKPKFFDKKDEVQFLIELSNEKNLWFNLIDKESFIGEGAEQKVFLQADGKFVIKINDSIFYEFWEDYFINLLIHNFLFPNTAYELIGFYSEIDQIYAVVKQKFIVSTEPTDLLNVRKFLLANGFKHKKNNDYFNEKMGIILEDLHEENVLTNKGVLFFIDTVIYIIK